jgi:hypothetical protein
MGTTAIIPIHAGRRSVAKALKMSLDYIKDADKTENGEWVTSYECDPLIADGEFNFSKNQYRLVTGLDQGASDVIAYHVRISFKPGETDAATANRIGYELAMKLTKGNHAFVCCTHVDKKHIHSHIAINSTSLDCTRKFRNFKGSAFAVRRIADHLCLENGLSIIANPKPSRGHYGKWQGAGKPPTNRDRLKEIIDYALEQAKDYDGFIDAMIKAGCEAKHGKHLAFKNPGAARFARCSSLGDDYTEAAIRERLAGVRKANRKPADNIERNANAATFVPFEITSHTKFGLLIDIQQKIAEGKGGAYEHWSRIYNLKQAAKTLIYLQENGIDSYDELCEKTKSASSAFNEKQKKIKEIESRQNEISSLQKQIGTYGKTRKVYEQYRASGWDRDFYESQRSDIVLHRAAKKYFDDAGYGKNKKLPTISQLRKEWAELESEKKSLYRDYKEQKNTRAELLKARDNASRLLGLTQEPKEIFADRSKSRHGHGR